MVKIDRAEKEDLPVIVDIIKKAYNPMTKILSRPPGALDNTAEKVDHAFKNNQLYTLRNKQNLIGTFSLIETEEQSVKLFHLAIKPEFQNQGIGSQTVKEIIKMVQNQDHQPVKSLELEIYSRIPRLFQFYKKFEFVQKSEKVIRGVKILILTKKL
ncbi:MAG: GNAT family N-acetyltransferase [Candidatus Heimdallarchaeota archaeon]|nr:MAG: GNAT family N-acetyltransferase [Candidatus Heimdallarchaeota archaeon]